MKININEQKLTQAEQEQLQALIDKAYRSKVWKPECDESYWYINDYDMVFDKDWIDSITDNKRYSVGNCYRTYAEAKFEVERRKVTTELKRFALEHNDSEIDYHDRNQVKYYICYNHDNCELYVDWVSYIQDISIYFTRRELCKQAIQQVGEDRIKKYLFGVVDDEAKEN